VAHAACELDARARTAREMKARSDGRSRFLPCAILPALLVYALSACAQTAPEQGGTELQVWTAGGHSIPFGTVLIRPDNSVDDSAHTWIWNAGLRFGWVLLDSHGPGFLRGRFEYAIDAVPVYLISQTETGEILTNGRIVGLASRTVYGVGANPVNLKWNFERHGRIVPYAELSGGLLFTNNDVPPKTSSVNFTPSAAFGAYFLGGKFAWALEARYLHISDAGLSSVNPGVNTIEVRIGFGKFTRPH
jgi:lipid A 3-O-deacylase